MWFSFMTEVLEYGKYHKDGIKSLDICSEIIRYQSELLDKTSLRSFGNKPFLDKGRVDHILNMSVKESENIPIYREEIYQRWGKYLPELKQHHRENQLNKILNK